MRVLIVAACLLLASLAFAPTATAVGDCIGEPGAVQVCQTVTHPALRHCVSAAVGLQGASVCYGEGGTELCTSIEGRTCIP